MRYFKYQDDDSPIGPSVTLLETQDGQALRQVTTNGVQSISSNLPFPPWGLCLAEGRVDYDAIGDAIEEISSSEFDEIWQACLAQQKLLWLASKSANPLGALIHGWIEIFFPQGVIVNLGNNTLGVANYGACRASASPEWMYPGHKVTAIVVAYDELNHWLVLDQPRVFDEIVNNRQ